jgi:hypothetical protein
MPKGGYSTVSRCIFSAIVEPETAYCLFAMYPVQAIKALEVDGVERLMYNVASRPRPTLDVPAEEFGLFCSHFAAMTEDLEYFTGTLAIGIAEALRSVSLSVS